MALARQLGSSRGTRNRQRDHFSAGGISQRLERGAPDAAIILAVVGREQGIFT